MPLSYSVKNSVDNCENSKDYLDTYALLRNRLKNSDLQQKNPDFDLVNKPVYNFVGLTRLIAKYLYHNGYLKEADRISNCGQRWIPFSCSAGHRLYRQIACGLPYCPVCSAAGAWYNKKRIRQVSDTFLGFPAIGHYVFTLPKEISESLPASNEMDKLYKLAWRILREFFDAEAGVIILHFCGDKTGGLHLHFDCSFPILHRNGDCDYPLITLTLARDEWTAGLNKIFSQNFKDTVTHYNFVNTLPQEYHLIKYITRSTIEAEKFIELTDKQKGYCIKMSKRKTIRYFGKFIGKKRPEFIAQYKCFLVIDKPEKDLIEQKICPICNERMKPMPAIVFDDMPLTNLEVYNGHTLIDRQIGAFLREQRQKEIKPVYSRLLDYLIAQESEVKNGKSL